MLFHHFPCKQRTTENKAIKTILLWPSKRLHCLLINLKRSSAPRNKKNLNNSNNNFPAVVCLRLLTRSNYEMCGAKKKLKKIYEQINGEKVCFIGCFKCYFCEH